MFTQRRAVVASALVLALSVAACGGKADTSNTTIDGIEVGPGVTEDTITLGMLTDLSGVFAPLGKDTLAGFQLTFDQLNAAGGICGRFEVELDVQDSGYVLQKTVQQYGAIKDDVLALLGTMGSPANAALESKFEADDMLNIATAWGRSLTSYEGTVIFGGTFDVDIANGLDYFLEEGLISDGDKVGHIYFQGDYGDNAVEGSDAVAAKHDLEIVKAQIDPTDSDMSAQITRMKSEGVSAVVISASPIQTASAVAAAAASDLDVPFLSSLPGFVPGLMDSPVAGPLASSLYLASPLAPTLPEGSDLAQAYAEANGGKSAGNSVAGGAGAASIMIQILEKACEDGDLTRAGLLEAKKSFDNLTTDGLIVPLNLSEAGVSPSLKTNIQRPDPSAPGKLVTVEAEFQGETARP